MSAIILTVFLRVFSFSADSVETSEPRKTEENQTVYIDNIFIIGNKKTKEGIILRELSVQKGETYDQKELAQILELDKSKLFNTRLFNTVEVSILNLDDTTVDIVINVTERWYIFPAPIFDLVDRNFNDWWQNQGRDFSRTNYGVRIFHNNFRGRNERLRLLLQLGFTRKIGITYRVPYIDRKKRHGLSFSYDYSENDNIAIRTVENKPVFFDADETIRVFREYSLGYTFRRSFYNFHSLNFRVFNNTVSDTVTTLNTNYYQTDDQQQQYAELTYSFTYDKRDFAPYPLKGARMDIFARKEGLGIYDDLDRFDILINYSKFLDLKKNFYFSNYSAIYASFPTEQPYANIGGLGFRRNFIRGYELYLIEGKSFYLNRSTFKKRIFSKVANLKAVPIEQFRKMPIDIYFKAYFDMGYAENFVSYSENSRLADRYLFGTGAGFDIVSYYDTVIRLEFTVNRENESGFFLHFNKEF